MAHESTNGVSYLASLKQGAASASGDTASVSASRPAEPAAQSNAVEGSATDKAYGGIEKRRSPRYKCEGSAELREEGHDIRTWATFTDISMHGCYVEANATYPVGTALNLKLDAKGFCIQTGGNVRVSYPYLGMGIAFTDMSDEDRDRLREMLRAVSRPSVIVASRVAPSAPAPVAAELAPMTADPASALRALVEYFENRQMLTREEFLRLLRKSQAKAAKP